MSDQNVNTTNIQACLLRFNELLNVMPEEGKPVSWDEISAHKEAAGKALSQMMDIFSSQENDVQAVGCKWLKRSVG